MVGNEAGAAAARRRTVSDVTRILDAIGDGDSNAAEELLPLVYEELRRLAAHRMSKKPPARRCSPPRSFTKPGCA